MLSFCWTSITSRLGFNNEDASPSQLQWHQTSQAPNYHRGYQPPEQMLQLPALVVKRDEILSRSQILYTGGGTATTTKKPQATNPCSGNRLTVRAISYENNTSELEGASVEVRIETSERMVWQWMDYEELAAMDGGLDAVEKFRNRARAPSYSGWD